MWFKSLEQSADVFQVRMCSLKEQLRYRGSPWLVLCSWIILCKLPEASVSYMKKRDFESTLLCANKGIIGDRTWHRAQSVSGLCSSFQGNYCSALSHEGHSVSVWCGLKENSVNFFISPPLCLAQDLVPGRCCRNLPNMSELEINRWVSRSWDEDSPSMLKYLLVTGLPQCLMHTWKGKWDE